MDIKVTGTDEAKAASPSESKFDKAVEAMKTATFDGVSEENDPADKKDGTREKTEVKDEVEVKEGEDKEENWKDRYKHVQSYADKMSTKAEQLAQTLLSKDPEAIHEIAKSDPQLADKLIEKELSKEYGIKTYAELVEAVKNSETKDEGKDDKTTELEERLNALEAEKKEAEEEQANKFVEDFKSANPDFTGEVEEKTWKLFNDSSLTLEQAYKYVLFESGKTAKESEIEEKVYRNIANQKAAGSIGSASAKSAGKSPKAMTGLERNFLEGIGATRTMQKHS